MTDDNPIVIKERLEVDRLRLSVMKFRDQSILMGFDATHLGINVHIKVPELIQFRDSINRILEWQGTDAI